MPQVSKRVSKVGDLGFPSPRAEVSPPAVAPAGYQEKQVAGVKLKSISGWSSKSSLSFKSWKVTPFMQSSPSGEQADPEKPLCKWLLTLPVG